jgi:hypothetical protein
VPELANPFEEAYRVLVRRCQEYVPVAPAEWAFSHVTAARLYRMPLSRGWEARSELDVTVPIGRQPPRRSGIIGHRLTTLAARSIAGLPVVGPELVWRQLAELLSVDDLVVAGDFLVRRKRPLSTMEKLVSSVREASGGRGVRLAATALADIRAGTDSPPESRTRLILVRGGLPEPLVRHTVLDRDGYFVGTPDLAYPRERVAIEYEGDDHWRNRDVFEDDIVRRELFRRAGWLVVQVTDRKLHRPHHLVAEVSGHLEERAAL